MSLTADPLTTHRSPAMPPPAPGHAAQIGDTLKLLEQQLPIQRRAVHAGDRVYQAGERFAHLYVIHCGIFKLVSLAADGREQVAALHFKGDWLGFDGIACARYGCDAVAIEVGEVWAIRYDSLLRCCAAHPEVMGALHAAMCCEMARDRDSLMSLSTLPVDARVAEFLRQWVEALACRGLRTDQVTLRMTRAEIGSYLGMRLESVSRALSRLEREHVLCFAEKGRRDMRIPDLQALSRFVQRSRAAACVACPQELGTGAEGRRDLAQAGQGQRRSSSRGGRSERWRSPAGAMPVRSGDWRSAWTSESRS